MATKIAKKPKTTQQGEMTYASLEHIVPHPDLNKLYRKLDKTWVSALAEDITNNGLDVPLITWAGGESATPAKIGDQQVDKPHFIIAGRHRREALRQIMHRTPNAFARLFPNGVPVVYRMGPLADVVCAQLRENLQRKDMTPDEVFPVIKHLIEEQGLKQREVAQRIGKSEGWVSQMVVIDSELGEDLKEEVLAGHLPVRDAQKLAREFRKAKEEGKSLEDPEIKKRIETTKKKIAKKKATVSKAETRKLGLKAVYDLYKKLGTKVTLGQRIRVLEGAFEYLTGVEDDLPKALAAIHATEVKESAEKRAKAAEAKKAEKPPKAKKAVKKVAKKVAKKKKAA